MVAPVTSLQTFAISYLCVVSASMSSSCIVALAFHTGAEHRVIVTSVQGYKLFAALFSGVIVPIQYLPSFVRWLRYLNPVWHAAYVMIFVNLKARNDSCTLLENGVFGCFAQSNDALLLFNDYPEVGPRIWLHFLAIFLILLAAVTIMFIIITRKAQAHMNRIETEHEGDLNLDPLLAYASASYESASAFRLAVQRTSSVPFI